ncbi:MAG: hypothetical protein GX535_04060 [Xanthomonadaceae bacterium]|nr:hypothetical protein [Xanthomonadaceae bacterium]
MSRTRLDRSSQLALRREELRVQCELQRQELAQHAAVIEGELSRIDRTVTVIRSFLNKPTLIAAAAVALALIGPARALRWISKGAMWYGVAKRMLGTFSAFRHTRVGTNQLTVDS